MTQQTTPPGPGAFVLVTTLVAALIAVSRQVSATGDASLVWPPLGIALGLVLARGWRWLSPVLAGVVLWAVASGQDPRLLPVVLLEIGLGTWVAVGVYRRLPAGGGRALADVLRLHLAGLLAGAVVAALIGAAGFHALGLYTDMRFGELFFVFWVTEAMGALLFAPLTRVLAAGGLADVRADLRLGTRWLVVLAVVVVLASLVRSDVRDIVALLLGLLVAWPAMRARPALLHLAVLTLVGALLWLGMPSAGASNREVLELVLRIAGLAILAQLLNAVAGERAQMLAREREGARRDLLTGLANERALRERMSGGGGALLLLRLEDFTGITDLLGTTASEDIERLLATELAPLAGDGVAARLGRGRYALLVAPRERACVEEMASALYASLDNRVFRGDADMVALRPVIGGVVPCGSDAQQALLAANLALTVAASRTGTRIELAGAEGDLVAARRDLLRRQEQVKAALAERRFVLFAQPIVPLSGVAGGLHCEILLRLREPSGAILTPGHFMHAAERAQLTGAIDRYVIEELLGWLAAHPQAAARLEKCAINLTGWSVSDPELAPWIRTMVQHHGIPPYKLCFEITESQAIASREHARRLIDSLREMGASVSLDDFGTGLATFDYLKSFPFDYLKIDGGFVRHLDTSPVDRAVVQAVTQVARTMGLRTIAEFVENDALVGLLREFGVDYGQGYGLGKPVPLAELLGEASR